MRPHIARGWILLAQGLACWAVVWAAWLLAFYFLVLVSTPWAECDCLPFGVIVTGAAALCGVPTSLLLIALRPRAPILVGALGGLVTMIHVASGICLLGWLGFEAPNASVAYAVMYAFMLSIVPGIPASITAGALAGWRWKCIS
jgi:hypothetical protein